MDNSNDIVFKAIEKHYSETGNLDVAGIQKSLEQYHLSMDPALIQNRIDAYKKSKSFRDNSPTQKKSRG